MAAKFNGKWKLTKAEGHMEFYASINTPAADMERNKFVDDPASNTVDQFMVKGDDIEKHFFIGGEQVFSEKYKMGELRKVEYEGGHFTVLPKMVGEKMVDIINRPGLKEAHYERSILNGDKMIIDMVNKADGIRGRLEFIKVE